LHPSAQAITRRREKFREFYHRLQKRSWEKGFLIRGNENRVSLHLPQITYLQSKPSVDAPLKCPIDEIPLQILSDTLVSSNLID